MDEDIQQTVADLRSMLGATDSTNETPPDTELLEVASYPEDRDDADELEEEVEELVRAASEQAQKPSTPPPGGPIGYVSNARNAASQSDVFQFWAPAEETSLGIGSLVRHVNNANTQRSEETYGIITKTVGNTLGLEDYAVHVYEEDAQPPLSSIVPAPSRRRPVVNYQAKVLASNQRVQRPVQSGPVYAVKASELAGIHGRPPENWLDPNYLLTGFYEDGEGKFGVFAEERARVLGPKQGHVILSGLPGSGKTSLFLTLVISLYAQLQQLEREETDEEK